MTKTKSKINHCKEASTTLRNVLNELQIQHSIASTWIEHTYERYTKTINNCRKLSLNELNRLTSERELNIAEQLHTVGKFIKKYENACAFADSLLQFANTSEFMDMKEQISSQLYALIKATNTPTINTNFSLEFDCEQFERLSNTPFGEIVGLKSTSYESHTPYITMQAALQNLDIDATIADVLFQNQNANQSDDVLNLHTTIAKTNLLRLAKLAESTKISENFFGRFNTTGARYHFGEHGSLPGQLYGPRGFCLGVDEEIIVANTYNHR